MSNSLISLFDLSNLIHANAATHNPALKYHNVFLGGYEGHVSFFEVLFNSYEYIPY